MELRSLIAKFLPWLVQKKNNEPISMVLLQRAAHSFSIDALQAAADKAWSSPTAGDRGSKPFVTVAGFRALVWVKPHFLAIFSVPKPYFGRDRQQNLEWLPQEVQRQSWAGHCAWTAIDYVGPSRDLRIAYSVLAKLAAEMIDPNITGVYVPGERAFLPNDGSLYASLEMIGKSLE